MKGLFVMGLLTPLFCILLMLASKKNTAPTPAPGPSVNPVPVAPPQPQKPRPGSQVVWFDFQPLNGSNDPTWGKVLTDMKNHLPESMIKQFESNDKNADAHETTHGINSHLNNTSNQGDRGYYCLYPGGNKAVKIKQPNIRIADVAQLVPSSLQKSRFQLYLIQQRGCWDKEPIYLWDEWIAYCNGADCGIELMNKDMYKPDKNDSSWGVLEFNVYATYVAIAQKKHDPNYDNKQLLEFLAWNLERGMSLYNEGQKLPEYNWDDDQYLQHLRTSDDALEFRNFLIDTYGADWTNQVFGFRQ